MKNQACLLSILTSFSNQILTGSTKGCLEILLHERPFLMKNIGQQLGREQKVTGRTDHIYVNSYKRKFAEQEFNALKRRCNGEHAERSTCIVVVNKEEKNVKHAVLNSVVGTLDLSIRHLLHGETFPRKQGKTSMFFKSSPSDANDDENSLFFVLHEWWK